MALQLLAVLVLGLMCGSELNVGAFAHRTLRGQPLEVHVPTRSAFAALLGKVMPFWMMSSVGLNLLVILPFEHLSQPAWRLAAAALAIQVVCIVFSLIGPVPINTRTAKWTVATLPDDWRRQENLWDLYHWVRTWALIVAFALLVVSFHGA